VQVTTKAVILCSIIVFDYAAKLGYPKAVSIHIW
jgi:hypothetical protein